MMKPKNDQIENDLNEKMRKLTPINPSTGQPLSPPPRHLRREWVPSPPKHDRVPKRADHHE
jgi:hypothetical protein